MKTLKKLFNWLFGPRCCGCKRRGAKRMRMNTQYVNDESNYSNFCEDCFELSESYWADMWSDYYGGRL